MAYSSSGIDDCFSELERMNRAIYRQQWDVVQNAAESYATKVLSVQQLAPDQMPVAELQQLDILHRRCMRRLSARMQRVSDDMKSLDHGLERLKGVSKLIDEQP